MILDQRNLDLERAGGKMDKPPPYRPHPEDFNSHLSDVVPLDDVHAPAPAASVSQVHIQSRNTDIEGTFYVDPSIPNHEVLQKRRRKSCKGKQTSHPHASFTSKKGAINLNLAATGSAEKTPVASVSVMNRKGNTLINLLPTSPTLPHINLEVSSHRGDIIVFVPETFVGVLHLSTRRGNLTILPALAATVTTVKSTETEGLLLMGNQLSMLGSSIPNITDLCELQSRSGKVVVGLARQDYYAPDVGFWRKMLGAASLRSQI